MHRSVLRIMLFMLLLLAIHDHIIPNQSEFAAFEAPQSSIEKLFVKLHVHEQMHTYTCNITTMFSTLLRAHELLVVFKERDSGILAYNLPDKPPIRIS